MKATGIVRRIDDLGRVVIPKEIRRTLHIRVGEPLEIFVTPEGEVVFKQYSPMGDLWAMAGRYAEVLTRFADLPVMICDRDHVVTAAGISKRECVDQPLCEEFEQIMEDRRLWKAESDPVSPYQGGLAASAVAPIICQGDVVGAVALLFVPEKPVTETQLKLISTAAAFFGRQLEDD